METNFSDLWSHIPTPLLHICGLITIALIAQWAVNRRVMKFIEKNIALTNETKEELKWLIYAIVRILILSSVALYWLFLLLHLYP
jgi:hypothetical protein